MNQIKTHPVIWSHEEQPTRINTTHFIVTESRAYYLAKALAAAVKAEKRKKAIRKVEGSRVNNTINHTCQPEHVSCIANYYAKHSMF